MVERSPDTTATVIVIAKEPAPGRAKTRLQPDFTPVEAAELAAAAVRDSLRAARAARVSRRILYWQGFGADVSLVTDDLSTAFRVVPQAGGGLADRLTDAFRQAWCRPGDTRDADRTGDPVDPVDASEPVDPDEPTLLIGMDTPQVTAFDLELDWSGLDAVIGLAPDGGYWAIGLRRCDPAAVFHDIPMSTTRTGAAQLARLHDLGFRVGLLPPLADVDTAADAARVAARHPHLEFSAVHRRLTASRPTTATMFDLIYAGAAVSAGGARDPLRFDPDRWRGAADEVDAMVGARCRGPVLDLGCGPGRLVVHLLHRGIPALGVDVSAVAIRAGRRHGATALQRDLHERLPLEGRWATVVLLDSNVGIGGDVPALLRRSRDLVVPGGSVLCEVDPDPDLDLVCTVELTGPDGAVTRVPWSRTGATAVIAAAEQLDLVVTEQWHAGGREFLSLARI